MNITLPSDVVQRLGKIPNKSAFIAAAIDEKLAAEKREAGRLERLENYKWLAKHPEYEKDARPDW